MVSMYCTYLGAAPDIPIYKTRYTLSKYLVSTTSFIYTVVISIQLHKHAHIVSKLEIEATIVVTFPMHFTCG